MEVTVDSQLPKPSRRKDPGEQVAEAGHEAVLDVIVNLGVEQAKGALVEAEVQQEPDDHGGQEDDGTGFHHVAAHALPHGKQHVLHRGQVVLGKLHDEGGHLAGEGAELLQDDAGQDDGEQSQEVEDGGDPPGGPRSRRRPERRRRAR